MRKRLGWLIVFMMLIACGNLYGQTFSVDELQKIRKQQLRLFMVDSILAETEKKVVRYEDIIEVREIQLKEKDEVIDKCRDGLEKVVEENRGLVDENYRLRKRGKIWKNIAVGGVSFGGLMLLVAVLKP